MLEHVRRSGGGLYSEDYYTFREALYELTFNHELNEKMVLNGYLCVLENYSWPRILKKLSSLL